HERDRHDEDAEDEVDERTGEHDDEPLGHAESVERPVLLPRRDLLVRELPGIGHGVLEQPSLPSPARHLRVGAGIPVLRSALAEAVEDRLLDGCFPGPASGSRSSASRAPASEAPTVWPSRRCVVAGSGGYIPGIAMNPPSGNAFTPYSVSPRRKENSVGPKPTM